MYWHTVILTVDVRVATAVFVILTMYLIQTVSPGILHCIQAIKVSPVAQLAISRSVTIRELRGHPVTASIAVWAVMAGTKTPIVWV
jgi:hypothetical protein